MNVLVIGDNPDVETLIAELAQSVPEVTVIGRIGHCVDLVTQVQVLDAHVVVADISGAGMKGLDTIYRLRTGMPGLGIIAVSSMATTDLARSACECGADLSIHLGDLAAHLLPELRSASARHGCSALAGSEQIGITQHER